MDELDEAVALLKDAPGEFRKDAAKEIIRVVSDYENWLSHGKPPLEDWHAIRVFAGRSKKRASLTRFVLFPSPR